jgi:PAS domain S-box-containing protein
MSDADRTVEAPPTGETPAVCPNPEPWLGGAAAVARAAVALSGLADEGEVHRRIVETCVGVLSADISLLFALEGTSALRLVAHRNLDPAAAARVERLSLDEPLAVTAAARTRTLQHLADASGDEVHRALAGVPGGSLVAAPLVAHGRLRGVLLLVRGDAPPLTPELREALSAIAELFAVALEEAKLRESRRRQREQLEALRRAGLAIARARNLREVLQTIVDRAREIAGAEYAALGIVAGPDRPFDPWVFSGLGPGDEARIGRHPRPVGLLGAVPAESRTIRIPELDRDPRFRGFPASHPHMHAFMGVPIPYEERMIGNLYLTNKIGAPAFSADDQHAIEILARHAGIAVEKARAREQIEREIEERRRSEEALRKSQEELVRAQEERVRLLAEARERSWLRTVIERSPVGILLFEGADGQRLITNHWADELLDGSRRPVLRHSDRTPLDPGSHPWERALAGQTLSGEEYLLARKKGDELPILVSAAPIRDGGAIVGAVVTLQDITPLKELARMREEWTSVVAHDLRQPVTTISAYGSLLTRHGDPTVRTRAGHILASARRLDRMIADLLDFSRLEAHRLSLDLQAVEIPPLLRELAERTAVEARDRDVRVEAPDGLPAVRADPARLEQVIANLLSNAVKYGFSGTPIRLSARTAGEFVEIAVENRGPGIPEEELPRLFQKFRRSRRLSRVAGIGLGLYIARGIVEAHGGRIWAESVPDDTTTFRLTVPVAGDGAVPPE